MANRIYIQQHLSPYIFDSPLITEVSFELVSSIKSLGEYAPALDSVVGMIRKYYSAKGRMSNEVNELLNTMDLVGVIQANYTKYKCDYIVVDKTGIGQGVSPCRDIRRTRSRAPRYHRDSRR